MERHVGEGSQRLVRRVVAGHGNDLGRQLSGAPSTEEIGQAVWFPRGEHGDAGPLVGEAHPDVHAEPGRHRAERVGNLVPADPRGRQVELDPLEEHAFLTVDVLLGVSDVSADVENELRHAVH
jgi:hypothetical protein